MLRGRGNSVERLIPDDRIILDLTPACRDLVAVGGDSDLASIENNL